MAAAKEQKEQKDQKEKLDAQVERAEAERLAQRYRLEFIQLENHPVDYALVQSLPVDMMLRNKFVPLRRENGNMYIAMADPSDLLLLDELKAQLRVLTRRGSPLSMPRLQRRTPAPVGTAGCGTGAHQRFAGAPVGLAGRGRSVSAGGAISVVAVGRQNQPHGRLEGSPAIGRAGSPLQRRVEPIPCRQPQ